MAVIPQWTSVEEVAIVNRKQNESPIQPILPSEKISVKMVSKLRIDSMSVLLQQHACCQS